MQAKTKKWIAGIAIAISVLLVVGFWLSIILVIKGCESGVISRTFHTEDFEYAYYSYNGERRVGIKDFTETGKKKEMLVVPKKIEGTTVGRLYDRFGWQNESTLHSAVLNRLYVPGIALHKYVFTTCVALEKLILYEENINDVQNIALQNNYKKNIKAYIKSFGYSEAYNKTNVCDEYSTEGINFYFANVSYMYNYKTEENDGYYWIDDYDYGSLIEYEPQEPKREGYTFGGWYREPECINKWDFSVDTLPQEITEEEEDEEGNLTTKVIYQETRLYAKWLGN